MWMLVIAIVGSAPFLILGSPHPRFQQPALRSDLIADLLHALVNGVLLDLPIAVARRLLVPGIYDHSPGRTRAVVLLSSLSGLHAHSNNGGVRPPEYPCGMGSTERQR
jgi:hypothetical protein